MRAAFIDDSSAHLLIEHCVYLENALHHPELEVETMSDRSTPENVNTLAHIQEDISCLHKVVQGVLGSLLYGFDPIEPRDLKEAKEYFAGFMEQMRQRSAQENHLPHAAPHQEAFLRVLEEAMHTLFHCRSLLGFPVNKDICRSDEYFPPEGQ